MEGIGTMMYNIDKRRAVEQQNTDKREVAESKAMG